MASPNHTVVVSVLGLSRLDGENFSSHQGIGKSCLCYRFMYPGYDDYQQDHRSHCSLLALHEFESDVILREHFLYWGSTTRTYDAKGSSEKVHFEVLEYPVFYEDVTDQPFGINSSKKSIRSLDGYMKTVLASTLDSPGKMSYKNRDLICSPQEYGSVAFPLGIGKHRRGYVVVIDVSDNGPTFESRLRLTENMVAHLASRKQKFICAATKRDESFATSLEKLSELARRNKFTLIEVSAKSNVNVSEVFEIVAAKVLGKSVQGLQTQVPLYSDAALKTLSIRDNARQAFRTYLQKRVTVASELLKAIEHTEEYKACVHLHGKFETDKIFAQHVLMLRNDEVSTSTNVLDKVKKRQQFLEAYVAERTDLSPYTKYLKDLIIKICQMCSNKVPILPSSPHTSPERNASTTDLTTIPNLPDHQQNTAGKQNNGDLCIGCGEATQKLDEKDSMDPAADTVKSGAVMNICGGYTITNMTMERNGNLMVLPPVKFQNPQEVYLTLIPNIPSETTSLPPDATIQTTEIYDFISNDAGTQEVDEEDGIYSVIRDCSIDLPPHVSNEDEESILEGQDDDDNYSYVDVCKSHYLKYDIASSNSDEYVPITEIEVCDEDDHQYVTTLEIPGFDTKPVAVPKSQQPAVQFHWRPPQLDPSSAQILQPLAQQGKEEHNNNEQALLIPGNTHLISMNNDAWNDSDEYIAMTGIEYIDKEDDYYVNTSEIVDVDLGPVNASLSHQPSSPLYQRSTPTQQPQEACAQQHQPSAQLQQPSAQEEEEQGNSDKLFLAQGSTTSALSERSANGDIDPEVVTMPGDGGAAARKAMVNDDYLKSVMELGTSKEPPLCVAMQNVTSSVTTVMTENNATNGQVEKPLLAKIRKKLGKETVKASNDHSFITPLAPLDPGHLLTLTPTMTSSKMSPQMNEWEYNYMNSCTLFPIAGLLRPTSLSLTYFPLMVILELPFVVADARELHTYIRVCQYTYAHLSNGDRLATLDMFPLMGIDLFKMPTSPMGINW
ncbi:hypothetical protein EMCRGX_G002276 [Ephydatia muelleri]